MKKVIFMLAAIAVSMSAMAQTQFGVKVGFDMTNFWGKGVKHGMAPNFQIGGLMEHKFSDKFAIGPEVVFAAQGGKFDHTTFNMNYINVPVMLKYYVTPSFSLDFGPQIGFNVYSKSTFEEAGVKVKTDLKDFTNTVDFGVGIGGTYNLTENAFIQARYTLGVTNVMKDDYRVDEEAKNGNIQVAFGWKF